MARIVAYADAETTLELYDDNSDLIHTTTSTHTVREINQLAFVQAMNESLPEHMAVNIHGLENTGTYDSAQGTLSFPVHIRFFPSNTDIDIDTDTDTDTDTCTLEEVLNVVAGLHVDESVTVAQNLDGSYSYNPTTSHHLPPEPYYNGEVIEWFEFSPEKTMMLEDAHIFHPSEFLDNHSQIEHYLPRSVGNLELGYRVTFHCMPVFETDPDQDEDGDEALGWTLCAITHKIDEQYYCQSFEDLQMIGASITEEEYYDDVTLYARLLEDVFEPCC